MREAGLTAPESTAQVQEDHAGVTGEQEGLGGGRARGSQFRPLQPPASLSPRRHLFFQKPFSRSQDERGVPAAFTPLAGLLS